MLKSLVVLSLLAIASASTTFPLSGITVATATSIAVTAAYPDAGVAPTITTAISYPTTYDSSQASLALFTITAGVATFTGNNTVQSGILTLTNGGDTVTVVFGATLVAGTKTTTLASSGAYLKFLNSGNYAASVTLITDTFGTYSVTQTGGFPAVVATKYTPPTVTAFNLVSPQSAGCDATSCTGYLNGTVAATSRPLSSWTTFLSSTHASTGVVFYSSAGLTSGAADFNTDSINGLVAAVGGLVGGVWTPSLTGTIIDTAVPKNDHLAISGQFLESAGRNTYFSQSVIGAFQASVQISSGSTDVTAPTCSLLSVLPATITTVDTLVAFTVTLACADESGGSGLWTTGVFATASVTGGATHSFAFPVVGSQISGVPPYVSGTLAVVGVYAIDNAGNAALYGSCGGVSGYDSLGCAGGGSSSSASTVAFSLFSVLLAVFVLIA